MLATALGFPYGSLDSCVPPEFLHKERISSQALRQLLDKGYFTTILHFSYNMKSGLCNAKVITKCLDLLERRVFSFADIQEAKVAFTAYENVDQRGVRAEPHTLLKAIKMCGFVMSPQKLSDYLKKKRLNFVEKGRLQLYEFLDLLTLCEPRSLFSIKEERVGSTDKTRRGIYKLDDMRPFMVTPDEKIARHLDQRFQKIDSWQLPEDTMRLSKLQCLNPTQLTGALNGTRPQPLQCKSKASLTNLTEESWTLLTPVPHVKCHCYTPKKVEPILDETNKQETQNDIEDLLYHMETLDEKSRWEFNWKLDYYLPGYRESVSTKKKSDVTEVVKCITKKRNTADVFRRLSSPRRRLPSPCHAMSCDAYRLGISSGTVGKTPQHCRSPSKRTQSCSNERTIVTDK
ncbi:hypothetical protein XELAEV_18047308mg [Xenopus laevis]|nr:hypothetical protein XELAEV_18047308mg [Xenopus laevis]